jgi:biotin carboxylase
MAELEEEKIAHLRYPLIVKPVDCNSSKGVRKVTSLEELRPAFAEAVRLSRTDTAIVEEFVDGPELSVDVYVEDGVAHVLAVSQLDKIPADDKFVIFRSKAPIGLSAAVSEHIRVTAQQIADAFGLKNSPMLIQMITDGERVYVLEFSARTGGGEKFVMIRETSGFDVVKAVVDLTLGNKPHVSTAALGKKVFATEFLYCKPGVYDHPKNFDELQQRGVIDFYYLFHSSGTQFDKIESSGDRVGGFSIIADSVEELEEKHRIAAAELAVINVQGEDMLRHDLLPALY